MVELSSSSGSSGGEHHDSGPTVLLFLVISVTVGCLVSHALSRLAPSLPFTPCLLVVGMLMAWADRFTEEGSPLHTSVTTWESLDGHTMLFIFLPPLLLSDSMNLQWNLIRQCLGQCLLLSGPGVVLGAVLNALVAHFVLPYGWHWRLCLAYGAVQSATDPVAVVSILSELGAPPSLTMIVSGESLLNDGSAIVMWSFFFGQYRGIVRNLSVFLLQLVFGGVGVGLLFGAVLLYWLSHLSRRHGHEDAIRQVSLTIAGAYSCFYVAEATLEVSGVLAVVTMGMFLATTVWPVVCSRAVMEHVWHTLEWLLNTVLFQVSASECF